MFEKLKKCEGGLKHHRQGGEAGDEAEQDDEGRVMSVECV